MLPKIEKARQIRASMAQQAQNILSDEPEVDVCFYFLCVLRHVIKSMYLITTHTQTYTYCLHT